MKKSQRLPKNLWQRIKEMFSNEPVLIGIDENGEPMYSSKLHDTMLGIYVVVVIILVLVYSWKQYANN